MMTSTLQLVAPITGVLLPIEEVPDPVFSKKLAGDGISIDPLDSRLVAPADGEIIQLHSSKHALTLFTSQGVEIIVHIGIDTVKLKGTGFTPRVKVGDRVRAGDLLIEFDPDLIATQAKSLLTQILIMNPEETRLIKPKSGNVVAGKDLVLEVQFSGPKSQKKSDEVRKMARTAPITIINPTGLHARPAAVLASAAKRFKAEIQLERGKDLANAKSIVSIMGMEVLKGDQVTLVAEGIDVLDLQLAVSELSELLRNGLGEDSIASVENNANQLTRKNSEKSSEPPNANLLQGVPASQGLAVGNVFQVRHQEIQVQELAANPQNERHCLGDALNQAKIQLEALKSRLDTESKSEKGAIFAAHQELLEDPDLLAIAMDEIDRGKSAAFAWKKAYTDYSKRLSALKNELLAARANDLRDVGRRVLLLLAGNSRAEGTQLNQNDIPASTILIAETLTPSDTASLDRSKVLGFCTTTGGASSHVAILARSLGIPAVAGINPRALDIPNGAPVIIDGSTGYLRLNPSTDDIAKIQNRQEEIEVKRKQDLAKAHAPSHTLDDHQVEVCANIGGLADAEQAVTLGGEGVGLLRSEFLFLNRTVAPTETEQHRVYSDIAKALKFELPLTIRTLDIGGDKPLPYLPMPKEENPFLGERGIRVSLNHPEMFRVQLRAILRAADPSQLRIMFPMIATIQEWREAKAILDEERAKLNIPPVKAGIMIEVPAAAIMADIFAREVDFFSVGTNDLTQYTLAMDRGHPQLAAQTDGLHPSVLQLIGMTAQAAHRHGKWVGVCGGIASDIQAVPILIGLGVDELSVSVPTIPTIKAQIRNLRLSDCKKLAARALELTTASEVRALSGIQEN